MTIVSLSALGRYAIENIKSPKSGMVAPCRNKIKIFFPSVSNCLFFAQLNHFCFYDDFILYKFTFFALMFNIFYAGISSLTFSVKLSWEYYQFFFNFVCFSRIFYRLYSVLHSLSTHDIMYFYTYCPNKNIIKYLIHWQFFGHSNGIAERLFFSNCSLLEMRISQLVFSI